MVVDEAKISPFVTGFYQTECGLFAVTNLKFIAHSSAYIAVIMWIYYE